MKSGTPWSLKGVDEETREAIYEAARKAGLSVSDWLNSAAGEEEISRRPDAAQEASTEIAASLDRLTKRLRTMDESSRAAVPGLVVRLDEVERQLSRLSDKRGEAGAMALKGVSAMVEKLARDVEDADERARTIIEGRRSRVSPAPDVGRVTEAIRDLDQRIARISERIPTSQVDRAPPLDDIRHRLNALLAERPKRQDEQSANSNIEAALRGLEARIDDAKARLIAPRLSRSDDARGDEQVTRIEQRISDIRGRLAERERPATTPDDELTLAGVGDLTSAIAEISAHQRSLDEHAETLAIRRDQKALSAAMAALRADIAGLTEQVVKIGANGAQEQGATFDLARRIEALSTERPLDRSLLSNIRTDLEALRGSIDEKLGEINRKSTDRTRLDALGEEVSGLRRALEADDSPRAIQRLEMRVSEIGRSVEAALSSRNRQGSGAEIDQAVQRLEQRLQTVGEELAQRLSQNAAPAASAEIERLEHRLDTLARSIVATLAERNAPVAPAIAQRLEERLDEISARIDDLLDRAPAVASFATMGARLQSLIETVEGLGAAQREPAAALDYIKDEIAAIRQDMAGQRPPDTAHLERQIRELADRLEAATRPESDGAALAELEAQVARLAGQFDQDQPRAESLRQVEQSLDKLQGLLSQNHRESIEAARVEARAAVKELADSTVASRGIDADLIRSLRQDLDGLRSAVAQPRPQVAAVPDGLGRTLSQVADRLGRLERAAAESETPTAEAAAPMTVVAELATSSAKPTDRRADFIAAARRAAQAAAAEASRNEPPVPQVAVPDDAEAPPRERKAGAFARISQAIRSRNRPLLLAAAAIVLALGAMQLYGTYAAAPAPETLIEKDQPARTTSNDARSALPALASQAGETGMVAPAGTADSSVAFAAPGAFDTQFGDAKTQVPAQTAAAPDEPVTLASAPATTAGPQPPTAPPGPAPDAAIGSDKLVKAAASGDAAAAYEVAARYAEGDGVTKDLAKAAEWYERAAKGGVAVAQYRLGSLYERGQGVAKNLTSAVTWYQRAADQGNVNAMHNLAVMMSEGADGPPDQDKALQWFLAAADYGVRDSQYNLGVIYARGLGTGQDLAASYKWFAIAASQGDTDAGARRDEVAKVLSGDDLAKARATVQAWHPKPPLADANGVISPEGGWDGPGGAIGETDRAALVKKIQTLLAEQGFDPGPPDGVVGDKTRDAVKAYQRQAGIAETGQIDGTLMAALGDRRG